MLSRSSFSTETEKDYSRQEPMLRLNVEYHLGGSRFLPLGANAEKIASEFESMVDGGMRHIYGDIRDHLQRIRAEVYQMAVEASATGVVTLQGVDMAFKEFETLLDG